MTTCIRCSKTTPYPPWKPTGVGELCESCWLNPSMNSSHKTQCAHVFTAADPPFAQFHCTGEAKAQSGGQWWCKEHYPYVMPSQVREMRIAQAKERCLIGLKAWHATVAPNSPCFRVELARAVDALIATEREGA